jgi:hypothetical protein
MSSRALAPTRQAVTPVLTAVPVGVLQRKCDCGQHTLAGGECEQCKTKRAKTTLLGGSILQRRSSNLVHEPRMSSIGGEQPPSSDAARTRVQAKLIVNEPGDRYEQEADLAAEQVMRRPVRSDSASTQEISRNLLQRREASSTGGFEVSGPVAEQIQSLRGNGSGLDASTRAFMEPRFQHDFSRVRVHTGESAAHVAREVGALAFTLGQDVIFGAGRYAPGTESGQRILAHELAHVVQQGGQSESGQIFRRLSPALCAKPADCAKPDTPGSGAASSWKLSIAVDKEQGGLGRLFTGNVGHTWVRLSDNSGEKYSYGFWPQVGFNSKKPFSSVAGCIHHPDTAHEPPNATNYLAKDYTLTNANYQKALGHAQSVCSSKPSYNLVSYNCTSFAIDDAKAAEVSPPASTTLAIHNPNALYEGIEENKSEGHTGLGALLGGLGGAAAGAGIGAAVGGLGGAIVGGLLGGVAGLVSGTLIGDVT